MSESLTPEEAREEARLNRHLNADPTTAKCIGGLRPAQQEKEEEEVEHNIRVSDPDDPDATLNREEERLARHVAASNARAKDGVTVIQKPKEEEPKYECAICHKVGGGQFCMIETHRNPRATVHVDCFKCSKCGVGLAGCDYTEDRKGNFFCDDCNRPQEPPKEQTPAGGDERCAKCHKRFVGNQSKVRAMGCMYHETCFACDTCGYPISSACYKGEGGKLYCSEKCARAGMEGAAGSKPPASKEQEEKQAAASQDPDDYKFCSACGKELNDDFIVLAGKPLHRDCFVCGICGKKLTNQVFNVGGKMACKECAEKAE